MSQIAWHSSAVHSLLFDGEGGTSDVLMSIVVNRYIVFFFVAEYES